MADLIKALKQFWQWEQSGFLLPFPEFIGVSKMEKLDAAPLVEKFKSELQQSPNSFIGQNDNVNPMGFLGNRQTLAMLRDTGKKHLLFEYPYYHQTNIDQFWAGQISAKEFVREYERLDLVHYNIWTQEHLENVEIQAKETANLIASAKTVGIRIGYIDADLDHQDVTNPHTGCEVQDGTWRDEYNRMRTHLYQDFNESIGRPRTPEVYLKDMPDLMKYLDSHSDKYPGMHELMEKHHGWWKVRVNENNQFIAQLIHQRTHGEGFVAFLGAGHLEGKDSVPAYLATVNQPSRVTRTLPDKDAALDEYAALTDADVRRFIGRDFTNPPANVLLLTGPSGKPEFYTPPADWIAQAQKVTKDGGFDSAAPAHLELKPLTAAPDTRYEYRKIDADSFAQSLICIPSVPAQARAK